MTTAHRGDLVVIEATHSTYILTEGVSRTTEYTLHEVTSVTRDGQVKAVRDIAWSAERPTLLAHLSGLTGRRWIVPADVDKAAATEIVRSHVWPGHDRQPKAYDSLEELRDALRPARMASAS